MEPSRLSRNDWIEAGSAALMFLALFHVLAKAAPGLRLTFPLSEGLLLCSVLEWSPS